MWLLSSSVLLGAIQVCSLLGESVATPVNSGVVELRIRKNLDVDSIVSGGASFITARDLLFVERDITTLPKYQPNSTTVTILEHLALMHRQKRDGAILNKREEAEKSQNLDKRKKKCGKKRKYKKCDNGPYDYFWNAQTKKCEMCPAQQKPTPKGDKCEKPETPEEQKARGKCPPGKILDPAVPGQVSCLWKLFSVSSTTVASLLNIMQNENTLNPKCVNKDQQNRCPGGQSESTPTKNKPGKCAPDPEPNKKCQNKDTYVHKGIGPDGKIKKSCRLSREKETQKQLNNKGNMNKAQEKVRGPIEQRRKERKEK